MYFNHEKLEVYAVALEVARWAVAKCGAGYALKDQIVRAAHSTVLNIAEGASKPAGDSRRNHFRIALGSAAEVAAGLDIVGAPDTVVHANKRVGAMLASMSRK